MTAYFVTSNSIGPGPQITFVAYGDSITILPGVTVGSTVNSAINFNYCDDTRVAVLGTLVSALELSVNGANHRFEIGAGGSFLSDEYRDGYAAITFGFLSFFPFLSRFMNAGLVSAPRAIGVSADAFLFRGENWGTIAAASPVVLDGPESYFVNGGRIVASDYNDWGVGTDGNNGVFVNALWSRVENLAGGVITAVGTEGAGVRFNSGVGDFVNAGEVTSLRWWGVDYGEAPAGTLTLINSGVIRGGAGAFRGHAGVDLVTNTGRMEGNVDLGDGRDILRNTGTIVGTVNLGDAEDLYDGRGAGIVTEIVYGNDGNDTLFGGDAGDMMLGLADNDYLYGRAGDDTLDGGFGNDTLHGGADDDKLTGGDGNDRIAGGRGADTLVGGAGRDTLAGGADDDELRGGTGADVMTGGSGRDVFIFASVAEIGLAPATRDRITDFRPGEDLIDLSAIDANTTAAGNQAFTFITGAFTGVAGQLRYGAASGLLEGDVNGDGTADFALELAAGLALSAAAIVL